MVGMGLPSHWGTTLGTVGPLGAHGALQGTPNI